MTKIYIVDAINFLFRSYYAIGPMQNEQGESTGALFGFIRSIQKLRKDFSPEYLVCVFDGPENKKSRQAIYAEYKSHRQGAPEDLFPQFELAEKWCKAAGIPTLCLEGIEADDAMAAIALWAAKLDCTSYLCTSDKDMAQLVNDQIFLLHAHKDNMLVNAAKVQELFGVRPDQMLDYLAIVGDASDNIPGLPGFGPKTAASLLETFGTLDYILAHPEEIKGEKKQQILRDEKKTALMSRQLASLHIDAPVPKKLEFYKLQDPNFEMLRTFYHKMRFHSLLKELEALEPSLPSTLQCHEVDTIEDLEKLLHQLDKAPSICLDTETTSLTPMQAELVGIGFCITPHEAWYIPCNGRLGKQKVIAALQTFFEKTKASFYGHNIKYDLHVLQNAGIHVKQIDFDTLLASYLINPQIRRHNLDALVLDKFQKVKIPIENLIGKGKDQISMQQVPIELVCNYCCEDVSETAKLRKLFAQELKEYKLEKVFHEVELPLLSVLTKMEKTGIYLDPAPLKELGEKLVQKLDSITSAIFTYSQETFNLNSPKQLAQILFEKLKLSSGSRKKTGTSTSADVLEDLIGTHPIIPLILEYRSLEKLRSTYIEALPSYIDPHTRRIHCTFNQSIAATGRLSCQDPNLQNIPVRTQEGLAIRSCFQPEKEGWSFIGGDYSQIELRILAHFAQDPELLHAFKTGQDIHTHTASLVYDIPLAMITPEMRSFAKTVNFGILYGQGAFGLAKQLNITQKQASQFIETYFKRYPKILGFLEESKKRARKEGAAFTLTGRRRPIPDLDSPNPMIRAAAERLATNTPLQGTAADLIKIAMIELNKAIQEKQLEGRMVLQIHDELIFEVPDQEIPIFTSLIRDKMEHALPLDVPIEVQIAFGKNWGEC